MSNLTTRKTGRASGWRALVRAANTFLFMGSVAGAAGVLLLAGTFALAGVEERSLRYELDTLAADTDGARAERAGIIKDTRVQIAGITKENEREILVADAILSIADAAASGVSISRLEYIRAPESEAGTVRISGTVSRQEDLSEFADALSVNDVFPSVNVPLSAFASSVRGNFTITVRGNF